MPVEPWSRTSIEKSIAEVVAEILAAPTPRKKASLYCNYFHLFEDAKWEDLVSAGVVDLVTGLVSVVEPVDVRFSVLYRFPEC